MLCYPIALDQKTFDRRRGLTKRSRRRVTARLNSRWIDYCNDKACEIERLRNRQSATRKIVLGIHAVMFAVERMAGWLASSVSLVADSLHLHVARH